MIYRSEIFLRPLFVISSFQFKNYSFFKKSSAVSDWLKSTSLFFKTSRSLPNLEDESNLPSTWRHIAPLKKIHNRNFDSSLSTHWYSANICAQANHTLFVRPLIRKGKHKGGSSFLQHNVLSVAIKVKTKYWVTCHVFVSPSRAVYIKTSLC